jgi:MFS family permease
LIQSCEGKTHSVKGLGFFLPAKQQLRVSADFPERNIRIRENLQSSAVEIQEIGMTQAPRPPSETGFARKQIVLGLITVFSLYFIMNFFIQTLGIARPRMAADLNGMSLYAWSISIPSLAAAFVTLLFSKFSDMYGRRFMLLICMILFLAGTIWSALAPTFVILIAGNTLSRLGNGALAPLLYSVLGDMFAPVERSKWVGLLHAPQGFLALFGPTLGGWFVDNLSWRHLYWMGVPLLILGLLMVPIGVPATAKKVDRKIDVQGSILVAVASSATILGLSFAGTTYPWASPPVISLLGVALLFWVLFFRAEGRADEPIMDPQVFRNRTFLTVAASGMLSFVGLMAMMMYYPIFLQGVQGISVMRSGQILTPLTVLMAFMGVPAGFILAKTKRYKWMYITGYGLLTAVIFGIVFFDSETPVFVAVLAATLAGLGLGTIPTINTLVVQWAVPKRLLGASMGAIFFSITMGMAIAPAVLGPVMNVAYANKLEATLPAGLHQFADKAAITALGDPKALLSPTAMKALENTFAKKGIYGNDLFRQTVKAIRTSMEAGLRGVFLLGAVTMLISFLLILTIPEVSMDAVIEDKKAPQPAVAGKAAG